MSRSTTSTCLSTSAAITLTILICTGRIQLVSSHGRLYEPPGRSTLWRLPEFQAYDPPPPENYDDDQLYCGGIGKMIMENSGKCGPCGDEWKMPKPRPNENGGTYGQGIVARNYSVGQIIDVAVELTANHWGYFEFRLCPLGLGPGPTAPEPDDCFDDKYLLELGDGTSKTWYKLMNGDPGWFNTTVELPPGLSGRAVLQWHYKANNTWPHCDNGRTRSSVGEGYEYGEVHEHGNEIEGSTSQGCEHQEIFRSCSDIFIGDHGQANFPQQRPTTTKPPVPVQKPPNVPMQVPPSPSPTSVTSASVTSSETSPSSSTVTPATAETVTTNKKPRPTIPPMRPPSSPGQKESPVKELEQIHF